MKSSGTERICGGINYYIGNVDFLVPAYWQSLPGISHSSLLVKRHNNNPKTNPNPNPP